jgi:predicted MFS family arabinose efflux permease
VLQNREPRKLLSRTALAAIAIICALILAAFFIGFEYSAPNEGALIIPGSQQSP